MKFTKNIWKGREDYIRTHKPKVLGLVVGTGSGMSVDTSSIKVKDVSCGTDHVGTNAKVTYLALYSGDFDPIALTASASSLGLPWVGDYALGASGYVYCSHTECKYTGGNGTTQAQGVIEYTASYSPITPDRLDLSPLERPPVIQGGGIELTEVRRVDVNQKPLVNSAGDYYENLPEFYIPGCELQVSWNVAANPMAQAQQYSFTTNSSSIWGQSAYSGVIGKISAEETFETYQGVQIQYWRITVPMKFRNDNNSWNFQPLDYGNRYKGDDGTIQNYVDPVTQVYGPVFLDGSGNLLGGDGTTNSADPVVFPDGTPKGYQVYNGASWSGLGVPVNPFS